MSPHSTTRHYTPHATLAALGLKLQSLKLFSAVEELVHIPQKIIKHKPVEKLYDAFISILAGAHGLSEVNTRLRSDPALQRAFGRQSCAEQSAVQRTLDACTAENVTQMRQALDTIFRAHSQAFRHRYRAEFLLLDVDMTGMPCGPKAELSAKGYFADAGIRYGRQLGRVVATRYEEIVTDLIFSGGVQLNRALRPLVTAAEQTLESSYSRRQRTILRVDAGGGSLDDVNWCLARGYQVHCKDVSSRRAEAWAATVQEWFDDPHHPGRQLGWLVPEESLDYVRPVRRLAIRWHKRNGQTRHTILISTLEPGDVLRLLGRPERDVSEPELVALCYAEFYDKRGGAIEIEIKEDKQGFGMTKRRKKRGAAQAMVTLLNQLAHNALVWARRWLSELAPKLSRYGVLRLVRDLLHVSGIVEINCGYHQHRFNAKLRHERR
ncbi:MAG: transposase [Acidobacteria bacterium]|nr:transposase [Acidobacteriota bacterium]MCA1618591.1 transposase [Acidobacteriota bacterium]